MTLVVLNQKNSVPCHCDGCGNISKNVRCNRDGFIQWLCKKCIKKIKRETWE